MWWMHDHVEFWVFIQSWHWSVGGIVNCLGTPFTYMTTNCVHSVLQGVVCVRDHFEYKWLTLIVFQHLLLVEFLFGKWALLSVPLRMLPLHTAHDNHVHSLLDVWVPDCSLHPTNNVPLWNSRLCLQSTTKAFLHISSQCIVPFLHVHCRGGGLADCPCMHLVWWASPAGGCQVVVYSCNFDTKARVKQVSRTYRWGHRTRSTSKQCITYLL